MASITFSGHVADVRGSQGGITYSKNTAGSYAKAKTKGVVNRSNKSTMARINFSNAVKMWRNLSSSQQQGWVVGAQSVITVNRLGKDVLLSGFQLFVKRNLALMSIDPTLSITDFFTQRSIPYAVLDSITVNSDDPLDIEMAFHAAPGVAAYGACYLLLYASPLMGPGVLSFPKSSSRLIQAAGYNGDWAGVNLTDAYAKVFYYNYYTPGQCIFFSWKVADYDTGNVSKLQWSRFILT